MWIAALKQWCESRTDAGRKRGLPSTIYAKLPDAGRRRGSPGGAFSPGTLKWRFLARAQCWKNVLGIWRQTKVPIFVVLP
jgi:hypothetical protein